MNFSKAKYYILTAILVLILTSCENKEGRTEVTVNKKKEDDTIRLYYDKGKTKIKELKTSEDFVRKFYKNGKVFSEGKENEKGLRYGKWKFFTETGKLSEIREYYIIEGESYLNQNRYISRDGEYWLYQKDENFNVYNQMDFKNDTLKYNFSNYTDFDLGKDTIDITEPWRAVAYHFTPIFQGKNSESIIVLDGKSGSFNSDFSNIEEVKKDTFFSLSQDPDNIKIFPDEEPKHTVVFGRWFDKPGHKIIRGYLTEFYVEKTDTDTLKMITMNKFFEKEIYVRDLI